MRHSFSNRIEIEETIFYAGILQQEVTRDARNGKYAIPRHTTQN